jgi:putative membrane protein
MKKLTLITLIALAAGSLQGCKSKASSSSSTDSSATTTDTTKTTTVAKTDSATANPDTAFANKAAVGGMAEVALGKLAAGKTSDAKIKEFANMMVTDHGKANDELKGIAQTKKITLPATLDAEHQAKSDSLSKLSGKDFDKAYVAAMVEGHQKTLALMQGEAADGKDADLKGFAAKTAPVVKMHLDAITKIQAGLK